MVLHPAFVKQYVANKKVSVADRSLIARKGGTSDGEIAVQCVQHSFGYRTDITLCGGIERRTIFKEKLATARFA